MEKSKGLADEPNRRIRAGRELLAANWDLLSKVQTDQMQKVATPEIQKPCPEDAQILDLLDPGELTVGRQPLIEAIRGRQSRRRFSSAGLSLEELSFLLWATQGVTETLGHSTRRTVPSAGSRHSFETYLFVSRTAELKPGLYRYLPLNHKLCCISLRQGLEHEVERGLYGQNYGSALTFVWTTIPYRMEWRYANVSHKLIALDAGHVCQNLYLACESIGCGTCAIGAYNQQELDALLGVDGTDEFAVYAAPVGKLAEHAQP